MADFPPPTLSDIYVEKFGAMPPTMAWQGSHAKLRALMQEAIERGRALTVEDMDKAQGFTKPLPPGALY